MKAGVKNIHLIIAVLLLSLFGIASSDFQLFNGLSLDTRRVIGLLAFAANAAVALYGAIRSYRIAWLGYLVLSCLGLISVGASTPIVALWLALKLVNGA